MFSSQYLFSLVRLPSVTRCLHLCSIWSVSLPAWPTTTSATLIGTLTSLRFVVFISFHHPLHNLVLLLKFVAQAIMCSVTFVILAHGVCFMATAAHQRNKLSSSLVYLPSVCGWQEVTCIMVAFLLSNCFDRCFLTTPACVTDKHKHELLTQLYQSRALITFSPRINSQTWRSRRSELFFCFSRFRFSQEFWGVWISLWEPVRWWYLDMSPMPTTSAMWCFGSHPSWLVHSHKWYIIYYIKSYTLTYWILQWLSLCRFQGGPSKQAQAQLSGLFNSIASFFHPSNHGRWLVSHLFISFGSLWNRRKNVDYMSDTQNYSLEKQSFSLVLEFKGTVWRIKVWLEFSTNWITPPSPSKTWKGLI